MYTLNSPDRLGRPPHCRRIFGQPPDPPPRIPIYGHPVSGLCLLNRFQTRMVFKKSNYHPRYSGKCTKPFAPLRGDSDPVDNHTKEDLHQPSLPTNQLFIFDDN